MSDRKDQPPLFELLAKQGDPRKLQVPPWMQRPEPQVSTPQPASADSGPSNSSAVWYERAVHWVVAPVQLAAPRGAVIFVGLLALLIVLATYKLGQQMAAPGADGGSDTAAQPSQQASLASAGRQPPNRALVDGRQEESQQRPSAASGGDDREDGSTPREGRVSGLNYFVLVQFGADRRDYAERAIRFLDSHGLAAKAVRSGDRMKLVVTDRGFRRTTSEEARRFERDLRKLGRKWQSEAGAVSDWSDLYAEKYQTEESR